MCRLGLHTPTARLGAPLSKGGPMPSVPHRSTFSRAPGVHKGDDDWPASLVQVFAPWGTNMHVNGGLHERVCACVQHCGQFLC